MINIVNFNVHCDDKRMVKAIDVKFKAIENGGSVISSNRLVSKISLAFANTTLMEDEGNSMRIAMDENRNNIADLFIKLKPNELTFEDVSNFISALQYALDHPTTEL